MDTEEPSMLLTPKNWNVTAHLKLSLH